MNRRGFVKTAGVASVLIAGGAFFSQVGLDDDGAEFISIKNGEIGVIDASIKANFGGGFSVQSYIHQGGRTVAKVEHLQNVYTITSVDLSEWVIISSSVS